VSEASVEIEGVVEPESLEDVYEETKGHLTKDGVYLMCTTLNLPAL
jgi:hypothetical protein